MNGLGIILSALSLFSASCTAPDERAFGPSNDVTSATAHTSLPGAVAPPTPLTEPTHYLVETEIYELPLAMAEELYRRADDHESTIGTRIDEAKCREALELLAPTNPAIVRARRADIELEIGKLEFILPREPRSSSKEDVATLFASEYASDYLGLQVRVTRSQGWTPLSIETQILWRDPTRRVLGRLPSATSSLPDGYWMQVVCLPSRSEATSAKTPALFAFLRVTPLADRAGQVSSPR